MPAARHVLVVALGAIGLGAPLVARTGTVDKVTIDNVSIVDVAKGKLFPNMTVVVDGERIASVAKTHLGAIRSGTVMDGAGMYVIPGLWDVHVHVAFTNDAARIQFLQVAVDVTGSLWAAPNRIVVRLDSRKSSVIRPPCVSLALRLGDSRPPSCVMRRSDAA